MSSEAIKIIVCDLQGYMTTGSGYVGMEKECLPNLKELKTCFLHGGLIRHNRSTLDFAKVLSLNLPFWSCSDFTDVKMKTLVQFWDIIQVILGTDRIM